MAQKGPVRTSLDEVDAKGSFQRTAAGFHHEVIEGGKFAPEADRYHLYIALGCPWANGTLTALFLKGLEDVIGHSITHPVWRRTRPDDPDDTHCGWVFRAPGDPPLSNTLGHGSFECDDALRPDTVNGCKSIRDLYDLAEDTGGKYTTPVLWCKKEKTIVTNYSLDILRILDKSFNKLAKKPDFSLFPEGTESEAEKLNEFIYPTVNNGVYRCGLSRSQEAYELALGELYASLERLEEHLAERPFLTGEKFTWLDLRLYHTFVRFDPAYAVYFKINGKRIADYPSLLKFTRRVYSIPDVARTTNLRHIKMHYFASHPTLNTYGIIPASMGPSLTA